MNYKDILDESYGMGEKKDCAIRAITAVSGLEYREVWQIFNRLGRTPRKGTPIHMTGMVLKKIGLKVNCVRMRFKAKTIVTLGRELPRRGRFLIRTRNHLLAAVDGKILDWTAGRRHRILDILEIT